MSSTRQAFALAAQLYGEQAHTWFHGYPRRDGLALLHLRPGRENPYPIYEQMRYRGLMLPTRLGNFSTTSHRLCDAVPRDRSFGVRAERIPALRPVTSP